MALNWSGPREFLGDHPLLFRLLVAEFLLLSAAASLDYLGGAAQGSFSNQDTINIYAGLLGVVASLLLISTALLLVCWVGVKRLYSRSGAV